ncbi:MAG: hypothetical protein EOM20_18290 [Spartobacteria bacterium]|nr:hypothetical protein [Spartobacteria bacterium]
MKKAVKKAVAKKSPVKKAVAKKAPAKKAPAKKAPVKKTSAGKASQKKALTAKAKSGRMAVNGVRNTIKSAIDTKKTGGKGRLTAQDRKALKKALQVLRDRIVDEITFLSGDNLNLSQRDSAGDLSGYSFHMADQGTDNFDREFALNLVSSEQDILYEIDYALQRLEEKTYGICEECGCNIEKARLEALPFARMCIRCKSEKERGKTRYRPFGPTITKN